MIIRLETLDDARLDVFARLTDVQLRSRLEPERAILIAESDKVAARALEAGLQLVSLLVGEKWLQPLSGLLNQVEVAAPGTPVFVLPPEELQRLTGFELTRGLLAAFRRPAPLTVAQAVEGARLVAVLENITNHTNVGAIFRSAAALGADAVLVSPACYDPFYRRAVRVSMGTVFQIPWARIPADGEGEDVQRPEGKRTERETMGEDGADGGRSRGGDCGTLFGTGGAGESGEDESSGRGGMGAKGSQSAEYESARKGGGGKATSGGDRVILAADGAPSVHRGATVRAGAATGVQQLQRLGFTVAAMALEEDSLQLSAPLLQRAPRVALVFGTEGAGLEPATIAACDATVCIPMFHGVDSLNVAASSAVGFYALKGRPGEALPCF